MKKLLVILLGFCFAMPAFAGTLGAISNEAWLDHTAQMQSLRQQILSLITKANPTAEDRQNLDLLNLTFAERKAEWDGYLENTAKGNTAVATVADSEMACGSEKQNKDACKHKCKKMCKEMCKDGCKEQCKGMDTEKCTKRCAKMQGKKCGEKMHYKRSKCKKTQKCCGEKNCKNMSSDACKSADKKACKDACKKANKGNCKEACKDTSKKACQSNDKKACETKSQDACSK